MSLSDEINISSSPGPTSASKRVLIFFITGNPGLIGYYSTFLTRLSSRLNEVDPGTRYYTHGASLPGFELDNLAWRQTTEQVGKLPPYHLNEVIEHVRLRVESKVTSLEMAYDIPSGSLPIVLIGHSVGAFILLELIAHCHRRTPAPALNVVSGICLLPTVVDIAKSPSGRKASALALIPGFHDFIHLLGRIFLSWLPTSVLLPLVQSITRMPSGAATVTAAFLQSRSGVRQALFMARDELRHITGDKWSDDLWGVYNKVEAMAIAEDASRLKTAKTKLFFYWGEDDHWIANQTRDEVIACRARNMTVGDECKPFMEIDTHGVPHGFCITPENSILVAKKVAEYILQLWEEHPG